MTQEIKEVKCPECERVWPYISEQGIVTELHGKCYACVIKEVLELRDERTEDADYVVQTCTSCGGLINRDKCISCFGHGWETVPKKASDIKVLH